MTLSGGGDLSRLCQQFAGRQTWPGGNRQRMNQRLIGNRSDTEVEKATDDGAEYESKVD